MPTRIQLSRAKGWRMPPNTLKVDRSTPWGNPFIVGAQGNLATCVYQYALLLGGLMCLSGGDACWKRQEAAWKLLRAQMPRFPALRGKNLACWCRIGEPCHADLLLEVANSRRRLSIDPEKFIERYGWTMHNGIAVRSTPAAGRRPP